MVFYFNIDLIAVIYLDGEDGNNDITFDPASFKTQFTHIYIVVKSLKRVINGAVVPGYVVSIASILDVPEFDPPLPSPPFFNEKDLRHFLMAKLVNGCYAVAAGASKFLKPNTRTRNAFFDEVYEYLTKKQKESSKEASSPIQTGPSPIIVPPERKVIETFIDTKYNVGNQ